MTIEPKEGIKDFSGKIILGKSVLNEFLIEMFFEIESIPDELQKMIDKQIQEQAKKRFYTAEDKYRSYGISPENLKMKEIWKALNLNFDKGKIEIYISVGAIDTVQEILEVDIAIPCSLTDDMREGIIKAIEKNFENT